MKTLLYIARAAFFVLRFDLCDATIPDREASFASLLRQPISDNTTHGRDHMTKGQQQQISVDAARLASDWQDQFASQLFDAAEEHATHGGPVTPQDLLSVLPTVLNNFSETANRKPSVLTDDQRRAA